MGFSDKQIRALQRGVPARNIRTRILSGRELAYIEGAYAIAEANRIFGFDGWDRETIEQRCIAARELRGTTLAIYSARVRLTVRAAGAIIVREGSGTGEARSSAAGEAHEVALKAAETDATKRALTTFGKPFGLALYLNGRKLNGRSPRSHAEQAYPSPSTPDQPIEAPPADVVPQHGPDPVQRFEGPTDITNTAQAREADSEKPISSGLNEIDLMFGKPRRMRDKDHLRFVGSQPCLLCSRVPSDAHHLRFAQTAALGRKVGDQFTVPLCRTHHRQAHESSDEAAWWNDLEIDAIEIATGLWEETRAKRAALIRAMPGVVDPVRKP
jgi:hypothetical protein